MEVSRGAPYFIIGRTPYGTPILDRLLHEACSLAQAIGLGFLAFDATRTSVNDVDFPVDVVSYRADTHELAQYRFHVEDLAPVSKWWQEKLRAVLESFPVQWATPLLAPDTAGRASVSDLK